MPNPSHTRLRNVRVPDERWERAMSAAGRKGEPLSVAINRFLDEYAASEPEDERTVAIAGRYKAV